MARSFVRQAFVVLAAVALAACGDATLSSSLHLEITPSSTTYAAGSTASFTIQNLGSAPVQYSFCRRVVQRQTPQGWVDVEDRAVPCLAAILTLEPGATITTQVQLPATLPAGTYRVYFPLFTHALMDDGAADLQTRKSSRPFTITP